jgi:hypothetical protein
MAKLPKASWQTAALAALLVWASTATAAPEMRVGPPMAAITPHLIDWNSAAAPAVIVDLVSDDAAARSFFAIIRGDTFRATAPNQFKTSALLLTPRDTRRNIRPYGFQTVLDTVGTTAAPASFHSLSAVEFINATAAIVTFARVPWYDGHRYETIDFSIDGSLLDSGRSIEGPALTFVGPGRDQDVAWAILLYFLVLVSIVLDPHAAADAQALVAIVALPLAHSLAARMGDGSWRAIALFAFSEPVTPEAALGSFMAVVVLAGSMIAFGVLKFGSFEATPMLLSRWWFNVIAFANFPAVLFSWLLLTRNETAAKGFFGFVGLCIFGIAPMALLAKWYHVFQPQARFQRYGWYSKLPWHTAMLFPRGFWAPEFTPTCQTLVWQLGQTSLFAVTSRIVHSFAIATVLGTAPTGAADCAAVYMLATVAFALRLISEIVLRVRRCHALNLLDATVTVGLVVACIGGYEQALADTTETPQTMYAGVGIASLGMVSRIVLLGWQMVAEREWIATEQLLQHDKPDSQS